MISDTELTGEKTQRLDLLSTSQKKGLGLRCPFGAPLAAILTNGAGKIIQCCCNHWECPTCGEIRARQEYNRIVYGAQTLAKEHQLYFVTLTCRGKDCSIEDAQENYYAWTNRLLTTFRAHVKKQNGYWAYVQVTERQKKTRAHPHSHLLVTALPMDSKTTSNHSSAPVYVSSLFAKWNESAGLGAQHKITRVTSADAVSRYVAKYLFKGSAKDKFPAKWKRVRYSRNYPKPPDQAASVSWLLEDAFDWGRVMDMPVTWSTDIEHVYTWAKFHYGNITYVPRENRHVLIS